MPWRPTPDQLRDSKLCAQLQVADLLASSVAHCLKTSILKKEDAFAKALLETSVLNGSFRPLWPEMKITPSELGTEEVGGTDPNEHVGGYVARRLPVQGPQDVQGSKNHQRQGTLLHVQLLSHGPPAGSVLWDTHTMPPRARFHAGVGLQASVAEELMGQRVTVDGCQRQTGKAVPPLDTAHALRS